MKKLFFMAAFFAAILSCGGTNSDDPTPEPPTPDPPATSFAKGADISWASEMEAGGVKFKKKDGTEAALLDVLKNCGINAIRLRVWVDPYKGWSGKADVVAVAKKVQAAGMDLMIDFHYSDFFADPSRQTIPSAWQADKDNLDKMCQHVSAHTKEVLQALKDAGVTVKWIQIGNETRNGMLWPAGQLWTDKGDITDGRKHFARLYNAGYDAAKAIYSSALVMPHLDHAYEDNDWWFKQVKEAGGKYDAIALSHYPQVETLFTATYCNQKALEQIRKLHSAYQIPIIISEVGVKPAKSDAASVLASFVSEVQKLDYCAGVFYWEPQVNGSWKPEIYGKPAELSKYTGSTVSGTWGAYDMGAFSSTFAPTSVLDCFAN
ncbi:MAG: glycosyl hydrolase 53 family protein [Bacteroidales bacterium]|nr:glycosyl hydrolase 53 family protein [Bacteroidales bacterium]